MADAPALTYRLSAYEGPLDLLYRLIQAHKIDICDIPINRLTEQYLEFLSLAEDKDMDSMSEFSLMAATLLEIKSRMLLPKSEEEQEEDPRQQLVDSLLEYRRAKLGARLFMSREAENDGSFCKNPESELINDLKPRETIDDALAGVTPFSLFKLYKDVLSRREQKVDRIRSSFKSVTKDVFTVAQKYGYILGLFKDKNKLYFLDILTGCRSRAERIVTFLAVLELAKSKEVKTRQKAAFEDIEIRKCVL